MSAESIQRQHSSVHRTRSTDLRRLYCVLVRYPLIQYSLAMVIVTVTTGAVSLLHLVLPGYLTTILLLYLLGVLLTAVLFGHGPAFLAALVSLLYATYFFTEPRYNFRIYDIEEAVRMLAFLGIALFAGGLASRARTQAAYAERRLIESQALYTLSQIHDQETNLEQSLARMAHTIAGVFQSPFCAIQVADTQENTPLLIHWGQRGASMHNVQVPLIVRSQTFGQLDVGFPSAFHLTEDDHRLLQLISVQIAQFIEQSRLETEAARARVLAESDHLKSALLSSISHDLRTPLTAIQAAVSELNATDVDWSPEHRQQLLTTIGDQTRQLHDLVSDLLDLSRVRAGAVKPRKDWYGLDEVILHTLDTHQSLLANHLLTLELPPDLPFIPLDFVLTAQVLANLLHNAVTHTPAGTPIAIQVHMGDTEATVCVADGGPGIPEGDRQCIFEPFTRLADAHRRSGSGVGLAICQGFIEAQDGRIWVDDSLLGGACFCFTLPRHVTKEQQP